MKRLIALAASLLVIAAWTTFFPQRGTVPAAGIQAGPLAAVPKDGISATIALPSAADSARAMGVRRALDAAEAAIHATDTDVSLTALPALARFNGRLAWMSTFNRGIRNNPPPGYPDLEATRLVVVTDAVTGAAMQAYSAGPVVVLATAAPRAPSVPPPTITTR